METRRECSSVEPTHTRGTSQPHSHISPSSPYTQRGLRLIWRLFVHARPHYLLGIVLIFTSVRYGIFEPMFQLAELQNPLHSTPFWLLTIGSVWLAIGGFWINDYFDRKHDAQNEHRGTPIDNLYSRRQVIVAHIIITTLALFCIGYAAWAVRSLGLLLLFVAGAGLLWFYSTLYKHHSWLNSILLGVMTLILALSPYFFHLNAINNKLWPEVAMERINLVGPTRYAFLYAGSLSILFFVYAHVKELWCFMVKAYVPQDTLALKYGQSRAKHIVMLFMLLFFLSMVALFIGLSLTQTIGVWGVHKHFTLIYLTVGILLPLVITITVLAMAQDAKALLVVRHLLRSIALLIASYPLANLWFFTSVYGV